MRSAILLSACTLTAMLLAHPGHSHAKELAESSKLKFPLVRTGTDDDVTATAGFTSKNGRSTFRLKMKNGPADEDIRLIVGGITRGTFRSNSRGAANVILTGGSTLQFDPRGREIELADSQDDRFLRGGGTNTSTSASVDERVNLLPTGIQPAARGYARYRVKKGVDQFKIQIESAAAGTYDVLVDGVTRGSLTTALGRGEIEFGDDNGGPVLDFNPLGRLIQVALNGDIILATTFLAGAPGISVCTPGETTTVLVPTAAAPGGSGDARLRIGEDCRREFRVEIEDVPVGAYELFVAGVGRGTIQVAVQPDLSIEGEIEFSSELDNSPSNDLPLDFDPAGASIEIRQGDTVFFTATAGTNTTGTCGLVDTELNLTNTGLVGAAQGQARFRQDTDCDRDFRVEVEKLPAGNYSLHVGGILRGTIAVTGPGSETWGQIEFDTEPSPGKILMTFDPRGQVIEVRQDASVFLTLTLPD